MKKPDLQQIYEGFQSRLGFTKEAYDLAVESFQKQSEMFVESLAPPKYKIITNQLIPKGKGIQIKGKNEIHCHPDHMYQIMFMGGVTDEAIELAGKFALNQVIKRCNL